MLPIGDPTRCSSACPALPMRLNRLYSLLLTGAVLTACGGPGWRGTPTTDEFMTADEYLEREAEEATPATSQPATQAASQPTTQPTSQP